MKTRLMLTENLSKIIENKAIDNLPSSYPSDAGINRHLFYFLFITQDTFTSLISSNNSEGVHVIKIIFPYL